MTTSPNHKQVNIPFYTVEHGYGGARTNRQAGPGKWVIVAACETPDDERKVGWIRVIVAPARESK